MRQVVSYQQSLFGTNDSKPSPVGKTRSNTKFPSTRYQGSKTKLVDWIWDQIKDLNFNTSLDAFGGTGAVAYRLKSAGKEVTYNDLLIFNYYFGLSFKY